MGDGESNGGEVKAAPSVAVDGSDADTESGVDKGRVCLSTKAREVDDVPVIKKNV